MSLPETVRVKLSSEDAGSISITPVVVREMPTRDLIELMLGLTGKHAGRVHEILLRGTLVSGASRFRWDGWDAHMEDIEAALSAFPDPDPSRPFSSERCVRALLRGPNAQIELPVEAGARRRFLRKRSFWDVLMRTAEAGEVHYLGYSYKDHTDSYRLHVSPAAAAEIRGSAGMLAYTSLARQLETMLLESIEFHAMRSPISSGA